MGPKYEIGQKVTISLVNNQRQTPQDDNAEHYTGQRGEITDYYWISPGVNAVFYLYTVRVCAGLTELVVHE